MEYVGINTKPEELVEAIRGVYGKDVTKDATIVYAGQLIVANGEDLETINKNVKCKHKQWIEIGDHCWMTVVE